MKIPGVLAILACLSVGACSSPKLVGSQNIRVVSGSELPQPSLSDLSEPTRPYQMGPFDKVSVEVFGVADLSRSVQIDANGQISLPLVGTVAAAGKTPGELGAVIADRLRGRYVRDPQVTVNLQESVSQRITLDGEVEQPGLYPVLGRMTLMRAIATAKGLTEFAQAKHVVVFRNVNNQQLAALYDLRAIRQGIYEDPEVFPNDVVVVGESEARRIFQNVVQGSALLTAPLIALIQNP